MLGVQIKDEESAQNAVDYNLWHIVSYWLVWDDSWIRGFHSKYQDITGWGQNSWCCSVNPDFISAAQKNYGIKSDSPAVDTGDLQACASIDFQDQERIQGEGCDIGMDEVM